MIQSSKPHMLLLEVSCNKEFQMQQLFLTLGNHVVSVKIFHEARKNPVEWRQDLFSYHVIHCNLANKPDRGFILNQFEDRGLSGGRGGGRGY